MSTTPLSRRRFKSRLRLKSSEKEVEEAAEEEGESNVNRSSSKMGTALTTPPSSSSRTSDSINGSCLSSSWTGGGGCGSRSSLLMNAGEFESSQQNFKEEDGIYWAYESPRASEDLRRKLRALDEASPTVKTRRQSGNKLSASSMSAKLGIHVNKENSSSSLGAETPEDRLHQDSDFDQEEMLQSMNEIYEDLLRENQDIEEAAGRAPSSASTPRVPRIPRNKIFKTPPTTPISHPASSAIIGDNNNLPKAKSKDSPDQDLFADSDDSFLMMASQAFDDSSSKVPSPPAPASRAVPSSKVLVKTPSTKSFNSIHTVSTSSTLGSGFVDDSFDVAMSQMPDDDRLFCQTTTPVKLKSIHHSSHQQSSSSTSFKRHGSSDDALITEPKSSNKSVGGSSSSSWKRNNSDPLSQQSQRCTQAEIERKRQEALKKRHQQQLVKLKKDEIELKRQEAIRRRNLSQMNGRGK